MLCYVDWLAELGLVGPGWIQPWYLRCTVISNMKCLWSGMVYHEYIMSDRVGTSGNGKEWSMTPKTTRERNGTGRTRDGKGRDASLITMKGRSREGMLKDRKDDGH